MQVKWTGKTRASKESKPPPSAALACGDSYSYVQCSVCERVCAARRSMRDAAHTGGVSYQQLVHDCFGVEIRSPDAVICSTCVKRIRAAHQFKKQLCANLRVPSSDCILQTKSPPPQPETETTKTENTEKTLESPPPQSETETTKTENTEKTLESLKLAEEPLETDLEKLTNKEILEILNKKLYIGPQPKKERKASCSRVKLEKVVLIKKNINCTLCRQKYPVTYRSDSSPPAYVCARCKLKKPTERTTTCKKCYNSVPMRQIMQHMDDHAKNDLKTKLRSRSINSTQVKSSSSVTRLTRLSQRGQDNKKFSLNAYRDALTALCQVCDKNLGTKILLQEHMRVCHNQEKDTLHRFEYCRTRSKSALKIKASIPK